MTEVDTSAIPKPRITRLQILVIGALLYGLVLLWPPLLLFVTVILSVAVPYSYRINDSGEERRRLWTEFSKRPHLPPELQCTDVEMKESYWMNDRGMALLTSTMIPKNGGAIRAIVCLCHGYMDNTSFLKRIQYQKFVKRGIAVIMIELEGHGRSDGTNALIPCWTNLVKDSHSYFSHVSKSATFSGKKMFLMGESMGGAVAFDIMMQYRKDYEGVIFAAPMVKILVTPPSWVVRLFYKVVGEPGSVSRLSVLPLAPSRGDIPDLSFKDKEKMKLALSVPTKYGRKPRLATARELLDATKRISATVHEFDAPFLVLHGLEDHVTCPKVSEMLYNESPSKDKEIKLYKGMYHNLTGGETDENIGIVFNDAIEWIMQRSRNPIEGLMSAFMSPQ